MIPKGTDVVCTCCDETIYKTARDIRRADAIESNQFADVGYGAPISGAEAVCPNCGESMFATLDGMMS